jgi:hypothetical protein
MTTVMPGQLDMLDMIDRAIVSAELQAGLVDRRKLPEASISGPERLLLKLVKRGLAEHALRPAAAVVLELERQATHQRKGTLRAH